MKQQTTREVPERLPGPPPRRRDLDPVGLATLGGVVALLMITFSNMRDVDRLDRTIGERLSKLEGQVAQIGIRPSPAPAQRGPDPGRVYPIKVVADAPTVGPSVAPVTIAEFSDFQ
jgi:protein-disulfide isomerase